MYTIRVGGVWLQQLSPIGDLKYSWGENGPLAASWAMALPIGFLHPALTQGKTVEVFYCGLRVWRGVLEEPDRDNWTCGAVGTSEFLSNVANLSWDLDDNPELGNSVYDGARYATGEGTPPPASGLTRGFDFFVDYTVPGGPVELDPTPVPEYGLNLRAALDEFTTRTGKRWMVDADGLLRVPVEPTTPSLALTPNVPGVGLTLENYYSATFLRYLHHTLDGGVGGGGEDGGGGSGLPGGEEGDPEEDEEAALKIYDTVWAVSPDAWRWGPRERTVDYDPEKQTPTAMAQAIVDALQAEATAAPTESVTLTDGQLISLGGTRVPLPLLQTGVMVRHYGVLDVPGARNVHEWVINHVEIDTVAGTATLTPRHVAPRTLAQIVQSISGAPNPRFASDSDAA